MDNQTPIQELYGPIPVHPKQTRLLQLHNGPFESRLSGSLIVVNVAKKGLMLQGRRIDYTALSYTWGDGPFSHGIILNGTLWHIKENLADFLGQCRSDQIAETYLWIDALVINQFDPDEKSFQVSQMLGFYEKAKLTSIWLGKATDNSEAAVSFLQALHDSDEGEMKAIDDDTLKGLQELYGRSYPTRMWIRQEVWGSRNLVVRCGPYSMTLEVFKRAAIESEARHTAEDGSGSEAGSMDSDLNIYNSPEGLRWLHDKLNIDAKQLAAINFLNPRNKMNPTTTGVTGLGHAQADGRKDIMSLLFESTNYQSTDIRDRIFALLGMCDDRTIEVTYRQSPAEVFRSFARHQILRASSLDPVLDQVAKFGTQSDLNLPSWVPDWRTIEIVRYTFNDITSFNMTDCFSRNNPDILLLHGFILAVLAENEPNGYGFTPLTVHWPSIQNISQSRRQVKDMLFTFEEERSKTHLQHSPEPSKAGRAGDILVACCGARSPLLLRPSDLAGERSKAYVFVRNTVFGPENRHRYDSTKEPRFVRLEKALCKLLAQGQEEGILEEFEVL